MAVYYGKKGRLVIFDATKGRDLSIAAPIEVRIINNVSAAFNNITANMLNPAAGTIAICAVATDFVYIGQKFRFTKFDIDLLSLASADGGVMVVEYWNGSAWVPVTGLLDGTAVTGNTLRQDGKVQFNLPSNWAANDPDTSGTNLFYVRFRTTTNTGTDAVAELIEPSSGQFLEVAFVQFNLTAPEGHARPEDIIVLNRGQIDAAAGYIQGPDDVIMQPLELAFTATLDDSVNRTALREALACGTPGTAEWPNAGISTKTHSQRSSGLTGTPVNTPAFNDPTKKTVCVQASWQQLATDIYRTYHEVYFDLQQITLQEAVDGVNLAIRGGIYGAVESGVGSSYRAGH